MAAAPAGGAGDTCTDLRCLQARCDQAPRPVGRTAADDLLLSRSGATGITTYLQNGGTIEHAQQIANHESPRTTKLYGRTNDAISLDEIESILI